MEARNCYRLGITDHAQEQLGEIVLAEVTALSKNVKNGDAAAVLESVKTTADIYAPADGKVVAANEELAGKPELINEKPEETWIFEIVCQIPPEALLTKMEYKNLVDSEDK
ncbi:UNVERIFIED_CONTAM: hypothetical protein GTU68_060807 [Idotea baltica]|nr:hypothetical protein [Idotea baltica]